MKVVDVLKKAVQYAYEDDGVNFDTQDAKVLRYLSCLNFIYTELAQQYVHLKEREKLVFDGNRLYYSEFGKKVMDIIRITNKYGDKVDFTLFPLYVEAFTEGINEVYYVYQPKELAFNDDIELPPKYTESMLALGVVSEHYFRLGQTEEALFFKNRYDTALNNLSRRLNSFSIKVH